MQCILCYVILDLPAEQGLARHIALIALLVVEVVEFELTDELLTGCGRSFRFVRHEK